MSKENILSKISKMSEEELKALARSTSDVETLNILAENANYEVRCTVAENKNTPVELLAVLAKDDVFLTCFQEKKHIVFYGALDITKT